MRSFTNPVFTLKKIAENAIGSKHSAGDEQPPTTTASTQAGDKTTWLGRGLNGHGKAEEIPRAEEEDTLAGLAAERDGVSLLTKDSGGELRPSLVNRPGEKKLQTLPRTALKHH
jgi:hypothetical protein